MTMRKYGILGSKEIIQDQMGFNFCIFFSLLLYFCSLFGYMVVSLFEPAHEIMVLITQATSEGSVIRSRVRCLKSKKERSFRHSECHFGDVCERHSEIF